MTAPPKSDDDAFLDEVNAFLDSQDGIPAEELPPKKRSEPQEKSYIEVPENIPDDLPPGVPPGTMPEVVPNGDPLSKKEQKTPADLSQSDGRVTAGDSDIPSLAPSAIELLNEPIIRRAGDTLNDADILEPPFDQAIGKLFVTEGPILQMTTRMTPRIAQAMDNIYNLDSNYNCTYLRGRGELLMRLAISMGGEGRREVINALNAGSGVPGEFYSSDAFSGHKRDEGLKAAFSEPEE